ncbi:hypothetical protein C8P66_102108 [Humitalea rosea]|uniref:Uncharacterized protein n=1 Tax=Humitalea rosea TaxID=990373 RepID=A0A2W7IWW2_9PROT|nr:hypothetical protein [Humitalea rosea]PZW50420.1 hypothetical protein C8P66_102108 [Humitalea rosea]
MSLALALGAPPLGPVPPGHPSLEPRVPPRLRALLSAARGGANGVLLLPPLASEDAVLARFLRALAEAHAAEHHGQVLLGAEGAVLLLGTLPGLRGVREAAAVLAPGLALPLFAVPAEAQALVATATLWFSGGAPGPKRAAQLQPMRREAVVILARGAHPRLAGWRGPPGDGSEDPLHWRELSRGDGPPAGFGGTAVAPAALLADPALLEAWRDGLRAGGGRLAIGAIGAPLAGWLRLSAIPADLLLLRWSAELPAALAPALRDPTLPGRVVLSGADTPAALAWGLRQGVSRYAGAVVEALLAATRLGACPASTGCTAGACAARAAAVEPTGCDNPALLRRWLP